jgi:peptidoglycan/LPS O-acetylase OafA/YrhL
MDKGVKFNVPLYYFHRYLRLTPALAAMLLAHAALFNYFGSGPLWQNTDAYLSKACRKYWWSTLLYIQNYANPDGTVSTAQYSTLSFYFSGSSAFRKVGTSP